MKSDAQIVNDLLDTLDQQREQVFKALDGLDESRIWQRPLSQGWCIGEILDHTRLLNDSLLMFIRTAWFFGQPVARFRRNKPFATEIDDVYQRPNFPMNVGWLWKPKYHPQKTIPLLALQQKISATHQKYRAFYTPKDPLLLGHTPVYDPLIGRLNLIQTLQVDLYHDRLHFRDVMKMAADFKLYTSPVA